MLYMHISISLSLCLSLSLYIYIYVSLSLYIYIYMLWVHKNLKPRNDFETRGSNPSAADCINLTITHRPTEGVIIMLYIYIYIYIYYYYYYYHYYYYYYLYYHLYFFILFLAKRGSNRQITKRNLFKSILSHLKVTSSWNPF